jgi:MFS family permease
MVAVRDAMANPGIRRLELAWMLGIAADTALFVVLLVVAYGRGGVVAAGLLGAFRMAPAIVSGAASGVALRRWSGRRILLGVAILRTVVALGVLVAIAGNAPTLALYALAAAAGAVGAVVRPVQATLMPALARTPEELVAANVAWGTVEGIGSLVGPALAAALIAAGAVDAVAGVAAAGFAATAIVVAGLRFEQASDAAAGSGVGRGLRLGEGLEILRRRPVTGWSMVGLVTQTLTRGLLNAFIVVAAVELLGLGDPGVGTLNAAMGIGGLVGGAFAMSLVRPANLLPSQSVALAFWGLPIAVIALVPEAPVAYAALAVIGLANAAYDAAVFTIFQRGTTNDERAAIFAVFEALAGAGVVAGSLLAPVLIAAFGERGAMGVGGSIAPLVGVLIFIRVRGAGRLSALDESRVELLRRVPAFAALPLTGIERLAGSADVERHAAGDVVMRQGDPGDRFLVIEQGEVEVVVDGRTIQRLGPGAGIGEVALLRSTPRTATVVALTDVAAVAVGSADFCAAVSGPAALPLMERVVRQHLANAPDG